ncbi:MAG TPA: hypothetical protein PLL66_07435 [Bacteroidales bacterium]|nr:hypothetical protein [Bacteroidales bacterium]
MKKVVFIILSAVVLLIVLSSCSSKIDSTEQLMEQISDKYNGKWFKQIKFCQTTSFYKNDSIIKTERWIEEYKYPSQLIIKVNHENSSDGHLYRNDSVYIFEDNEIKYQNKATHDLVILSMDIYNMKKDEIMKRLSGLDYDLNKFHEDNYNGRKIYVIGADKGDNKTNQLWFDAENLYFIKLTKNTDIGLQEIYLNEYINIEGQGWIEQEVVFVINGEVNIVEKYYNIEIPQESIPEINVNDFSKFKLDLNNKIKYFINFDYSTHGKGLLILFYDNISYII